MFIIHPPILSLLATFPLVDALLLEMLRIAFLKSKNIRPQGFGFPWDQSSAISMLPHDRALLDAGTQLRLDKFSRSFFSHPLVRRAASLLRLNVLHVNMGNTSPQRCSRVGCTNPVLYLHRPLVCVHEFTKHGSYVLSLLGAIPS